MWREKDKSGARGANQARKPNARADWRGKSDHAPPVADRARPSRSWLDFGRAKTEDGKLKQRIKLGVVTATFLGLVAWFIILLFWPDTKVPLIAVAVTDYNEHTPPNSFAAEDIARLRNTSPDNVEFIGSEIPEIRRSDDLLLHLARRLHAAKPGGPDGDVVLLAISAHGALNENGDPCLLFRGQDLQEGYSAGSDWLPLKDLLDYLDENGGRGWSPKYQRVLILDCARIDADWRMGVLYNGFAAKVVQEIERRQDKSLHVLLSADTGQRSFAAPELGASAFGYFLSLGLQGDADRDSNNEVTLRELYEYLAAELGAWARANRNAEQRPVLASRPNADFAIVHTKSGVSPSEADDPPLNDATLKQHLAELAAHWMEHQRLRDKSPPPWRYDPVGWAELEGKLLRAESLLWAGKNQKYTEELSQLTGEGGVIAGLLSRLDQLPERVADLHASSLPLAMQWGELSGEWRQSLDQRLNAPPPKTPPAADAKADQPPPNALEAGYLAWSQALRLNGAIDSGKLREALGPSPAARTPGLIEPHYLRMLIDYIDWDSGQADLGRVVQRSLAARDQAERAAAPEDERAHYWVQPAVHASDVLRRQAEDQLFRGSSADLQSASAAFVNLVKQDEADNRNYAAAQQTAQNVTHALRVRDEAWAKAPHLARWVLAQLRRNGIQANAAVGGLDTLLADFLRNTHALGARLEEPQNEGDLEALTGAVEQSLQQFSRLIEDQGDRFRNERGLNSANLAILETEILALPLISGETRGKLLNDYRYGLMALDASAGERRRSTSSSIGSGETDEKYDAWRKHEDAFLEWMAHQDPHPARQILDKSQVKVAGVTLHPVNDQKFSSTTEEAARDRTRDRVNYVTHLAKKGGEIRNLLRDARVDLEQLLDESVRGLQAGAQEPLLVRRGADWADRLARAATPILNGRTWESREGDPGRNDPARVLRSIDLHHQCLWHAYRVLEDFWGSDFVAGSASQPFFQTAADAYLSAARDVALRARFGDPQQLRYEGIDLRNLVVQRSTAAVGLQLTADQLKVREGEPLFPHAMQVTARSELPQGQASAYLLRGALVPVVNEERTEIRRHAVSLPNSEQRQTRVAYYLRAEEVQKAGAEDWYAVLYYRGHARRVPVRAPAMGPSVVVVIKPNPPIAPQITVHPDENVVQRVMFVFDCSGSMVTVFGSRNRLEIARDTLLDVLADLPPKRFQIGLRLYGHRARIKNNQFDPRPWSGAAAPRPGGTTADDLLKAVRADSELVVPLQGMAAAHPQFQRFLAAVEPWGYTPLYYSMVKALEDMAGAPSPRRIVVITDGVDQQHEFPNFNLLKFVQAADVSNAQPRTGKIPIDVVAIDVDTTTRSYAELRRLVVESGGKEANATDSDELRRKLLATLDPFEYRVPSPNANASAPRLSLGETWTAEAAPRSPEKRRVELVPGSIASEVTLEGGEALQLFLSLDENRLKHKRYDPEEFPIKDQAEVDQTFLGAHLVVDKVGTFRKFRVSVQNRDETEFSPRPKHLWAEIRPIPPAPDGRVYHFFDLDFEPGHPVPVLQFQVQDWPLESRQAEIRVWLKFGETEVVPNRRISVKDGTAAENFTVEGLEGIDFRVEVKYPTSPGDLTQIAVIEEHQAGEDLHRARVQMSPLLPPDEIRHRYFLDGQRVRHVFSYENLSLRQVDALQIEITSRERIQNQAVTNLRAAQGEKPLVLVVGEDR